MVARRTIVANTELKMIITLVLTWDTAMLTNKEPIGMAAVDDELNTADALAI